MTNGPVLVAGATGMQGGGVARALLREGFKVRALSRNAQSVESRTLAAAGAEMIEGDFEDRASLDRAVSGAAGVFSVQLPARPQDPDSEVRTARNLVEAALAAGVTQLVHTSVARAGEHESFVGWAEGRWSVNYWQAKAAVNDLVRSAGFPHSVIFKPAFYMENFIPPRAAWMYPGLEKGRICSAMPTEAKQEFLSARDIAAFAVAAFRDPSRFDNQDIPIAAEALTMGEVAAIISKHSGKTVTAHAMSYDEAVAAGVSPGVALSQAWTPVEGYRVRFEEVRSHGLPLDSFEAFAKRHAKDFDIR